MKKTASLKRGKELFVAESTPSKKANPEDKKVLVVDDDDSVLSLLKTTLDIEGFQVKTLRDGRNILSKAVEFKPDLIVCDLMMPGAGGYDVLRVLQGDPITHKVPVIIVTGSHMNASTKDLMKQESNLAGYFEKPIRGERLVREIHKLLNTITLGERRAQSSQDMPPDLKDKW